MSTLRVDESCPRCTRYFRDNISRSSPIARRVRRPTRNKVYCPGCYGVPVVKQPPADAEIFGLASSLAEW